MWRSSIRGTSKTDTTDGWRMQLRPRVSKSEILGTGARCRRKCPWATRPMIFPWRPYNKICIWSTAACRLDKDYEPLSDWAERRNRESGIGKWSVAHNDFSKFPVSMSVGTDAWIDWTPEQLGAAIRGVAEEAAVAIREFGNKFPDDDK